MLGLLLRCLAAFATFGSFITLVISLRDVKEPWTNGQAILMAFSILGFIATVVLEVSFYVGSRPKVFSDERGIRNYMYQWLRRGGRVAIFSRSLGWLQDEEMTRMMNQKSEDGELTLVMPAAVANSAKLVSKGAEAIYYGDDYSIRSRFTIVNRGRADTAVAIGRKNAKGKHIVTEYRASDDDPAYWLAEDMIELMMRHSKQEVTQRADG